jgi:lipoprotein-anchoring transpeptidase ErfK/SrfK
MFRTLRAALAAVPLTLAATALQAGPLSPDPGRHPVDDPASLAEPAEPQVPIRFAQAGRLGGGFIEYLFNGGDVEPPRYSRRDTGVPAYNGWNVDPSEEPAQQDIDPKYFRQTVDYDGSEPPGTIIIDTPGKFLFLVQPGHTALRYGIGVGRPGYTWAGIKQVSMKREWPDWRPPADMLKRRPDLPTFMAGGPENPLGARALYLGSTLYRIHGSNEPWTIGTQVSSGCIRMRNEDVIDLYDRVRVGAKVVVM